MASDEKSRIRLKLPSGLEVEAEGASDFVQAQVRELLELASDRLPKSSETALPEPARAGGLAAVIEQTGDQLSLRAIGGAGVVEACLLLLLASETLLGQARPTAAQVARWLRASGLNVGRIDRILAPALQNGRVLASGSRRSRRYELSAKGRIGAMLAAEKLGRQLGLKNQGTDLG